MSVLIKGMDMPKNCCECFAFKSTMSGYFLCKASGIAFGKWLPLKTPDWCPLVEVKTPHGRLKDVDVLHEKMYHEAFEVDSEMQKWDSGCWIRYKVFENCESDCPTVIESEE